MREKPRGRQKERERGRERMTSTDSKVLSLIVKPPGKAGLVAGADLAKVLKKPTFFLEGSRSKGPTGLAARFWPSSRASGYNLYILITKYLEEKRIMETTI